MEHFPFQYSKGEEGPGILSLTEQWLVTLKELGLKTVDLSPLPGPKKKEGSPASFVLKVIREDIGECTRCRLCKSRRTIVYGAGNPNADLMFVGEGPGSEEDRQGLPFVGRAGQLLTKIIEAIQMKREEVYIANVVKCRPPQNRTPLQDEIDTCFPFLMRQIEAISPKLIVALGKVAAFALLGIDVPVSRLRGHFQHYKDVLVMPTYHPAYLLRNPEMKRFVWDDMKQVKRELDRLTGKK